MSSPSSRTCQVSQTVVSVHLPLLKCSQDSWNRNLSNLSRLAFLSEYSEYSSLCNLCNSFVHQFSTMLLLLPCCHGCHLTPIIRLHGPSSLPYDVTIRLCLNSMLPPHSPLLGPQTALSLSLSSACHCRRRDGTNQKKRVCSDL